MCVCTLVRPEQVAVTFSKVAKTMDGWTYNMAFPPLSDLLILKTLITMLLTDVFTAVITSVGPDTPGPAR